MKMVFLLLCKIIIQKKKKKTNQWMKFIKWTIWVRERFYIKWTTEIFYTQSMLELGTNYGGKVDGSTSLYT